MAVSCQVSSCDGIAQRWFQVEKWVSEAKIVWIKSQHDELFNGGSCLKQNSFGCE